MYQLVEIHHQMVKIHISIDPNPYIQWSKSVYKTVKIRISIGQIRILSVADARPTSTPQKVRGHTRRGEVLTSVSESSGHESGRDPWCRPCVMKRA